MLYSMYCSMYYWEDFLGHISIKAFPSRVEIKEINADFENAVLCGV